MLTCRCFVCFIAVLTSLTSVVCSECSVGPVLTHIGSHSCEDFPLHYDDVANQNFLVFYVKGTHWVGIALTSSIGDITAHALVVYIGANGNTAVAFYDMDVCLDFGSSYSLLSDEDIDSPLSSTEFRPFWISWTTEKVYVGRGLEVNQETIAECEWPENAQTEVNDIFMAGYSSYEIRIVDDFFCETTAAIATTTKSITEVTTEATTEAIAESTTETNSETTTESVVETSTKNQPGTDAETTIASNTEATQNTHGASTETVFQTTITETPTDTDAQTATETLTHADTETTPGTNNNNAATSAASGSGTSPSQSVTPLEAEGTTTGASTATSRAPPRLSREQRGCNCIQDDSGTPVTNRTELMEAVLKATEVIRKELTVSASNTSSSVRRKNSAKDDRASVSTMGSVGAVLCSLPLVAIVLADVVAAMRHLGYAIYHRTDV